MKPVTENWNTETDGPLTLKALEAKILRGGYKISVYTYSPGTYFGPHTHDCDKADGVISGTLEVVMKEKRHILKAGDILFIPKGVLHSARVIGQEPVISVDGILK